MTVYELMRQLCTFDPADEIGVAYYTVDRDRRYLDCTGALIFASDGKIYIDCEPQ